MADTGSTSNLAEKSAAPGQGGEKATEEKESKRVFTYPLVKVSLKHPHP